MVLDLRPKRIEEFDQALEHALATHGGKKSTRGKRTE